MHVVIIGGGIIGAALAHRLSEAGAQVTVIEGSPGATAASFGWINSSFYLNDDHFALRTAGLEAWRRLGGHVTWSGCLCWEETGEAFDTQRDQLSTLGYAVEELDAAAFNKREPHIKAPERALLFAQEGVATPAQAAKALLAGARRITGVQVIGISTKNGVVTGVDTAQGHMPADRVVVAAGTGSPRILESVGVTLPMLDRPGLMLRTRPIAPVMSHILVAPGQELRQDAQGHIWAPTAANHQSDAAKEITTRPDLLADAALARLQDILPDHPLVWDRVMLAQRPVPQDGLPVIGACGPSGLFTAVMHSGVTLAAITADLLAPQVMDVPLSNAQNALVAPYTPARFQSG